MNGLSDFTGWNRPPPPPPPPPRPPKALLPRAPKALPPPKPDRAPNEPLGFDAPFGLGTSWRGPSVRSWHSVWRISILSPRRTYLPWIGFTLPPPNWRIVPTMIPWPSVLFPHALFHLVSRRHSILFFMSCTTTCTRPWPFFRPDSTWTMKSFSTFPFTAAI